MCSLIPQEGFHNSSEYEPEYDFGECEYPETNSYSVNFEADTVKIVSSVRFSFMPFFAVLMVFAVVGNVATLYVVRSRPNSVTYKYLLASLACSDLCNAVVTGVVNICNLSTDLMDWLLGELLCALIPFLQNASSVANSLTLTCVALDRFQAIRSVTPGGRWQPGRWVCSLVLLVVWGVACGVASPLYETYAVSTAYIVQCNATNSTERCTRIERCMLKKLPENADYNIVLFSVIFVPLLYAFLGLHGVIAWSVWLRRKPISHQQSASSSSAAALASCSPSLNGTKRTTVSGADSGTSSRAKSPAVCKAAKPIKPRSVHRERNVRTFRRIIIMMLVFFALRLPSWSSTVFFSNVFLTENTPKFWHLRYGFHLLTMLHSAVNPLLYCFSDETLRWLRKFGGWVRWLGCGRRSFFSSNLSLPRRAAPISPMVPRSPYSDPQKQDKEGDSKWVLAVPGPSHI